MGWRSGSDQVLQSWVRLHRASAFYFTDSRRSVFPSSLAVREKLGMEIAGAKVAVSSGHLDTRMAEDAA